MIPHREILALRAAWLLRADVIEKDWALGWVLAGIAAHPQLATWVFKGGTCLRTSYYQTYRFSEDLDFTVVSDGPDDPGQVTEIFREVATWSPGLTASAGVRGSVGEGRPGSRPATLCSCLTTLRYGAPGSVLVQDIGMGCLATSA